MKICVISDLHCKYQRDLSEPSETFLFSNMPRKPINQNPVTAILKIIDEDESIKSDMVLCIGDLGDKADEQGIISAWSSVEEIKRKMNAEILIGVPGNHDINSRKILDKKPFEFIRNFHEGFPTPDSDLNSKFWDKGYSISINDNTLTLLINTVIDHDDENEANSSNIEKGTLEEIQSELANMELSIYEYKICILHHHPIKHSDIKNWKDADSLENGDDLLSLLNKNSFSIVIHGHKHQPRVTECNGITILAAGSFSSFANLQGTGFQTMFHVVDLEKNSRRGIIHSWEFNLKNGWEKKLNSSFPPKIGFGATLNLDDTAKKIKVIYDVKKTTILYSEILEQLPELEFLIPEKLEVIGGILSSEYNLCMSPQYPLTPNILMTTHN